MKMDRSKLDKLGRDSAGTISGWPLRRKLVLAIAVPLIVAAFLGLTSVTSSLSESRNASTSANQVTVLPPAIKYVRAAEAAMIASNTQGATSAGDLDDALDVIRDATAELETTAKNAELTDAQATQVQTLLDLSQDVRSEAAAQNGSETWVAQLRQIQASLTQLINLIINEQNEPEPRLELLSQALTGRLALAMQQSLAGAGGEMGKLSQSLSSELGVEAASIDRLASAIGQTESTIPTLRTENGRRAESVRAASNVSDLDLGTRSAYVPYDQLIDQLLGEIDTNLSANASSARTDGLRTLGLTVLALLLAVVIALVVTRLLLDPINRVRDGARKVAHETLPDAVAMIRSGQEPPAFEPIDVDTNEEIGQLARAVDDLHAQAVHLASGEARLRATVGEMFVTLSRRSNSLINQQLTLIERLENDEEDPKRLESLFRLDHLASRMRRTADSLLILADSPNTGGAEYTLSVSDAVQAASAGVQDYHRLQVSSHLSTLIAGNAAADVVHLLTELVDNALSYSSPNDPVRVETSIDSSGAVIKIADAGIGIPADERTALNTMLREGSEATPETARRMGLFVVSRLAKRHNIAVELIRGEFGGTIVRVVLPATILPELPQPSSPIVHTYETEDAVAAPQAPLYEELSEVEATETTAHGLPKRGSRRSPRGSEERKPLIGSKKPVEAEPTPEPAPEVEPVTAYAEPQVEPQPVEDLVVDAPPATPAAPPAPAAPGLGGGLLPRRNPGAQVPMTSPDALVPITSASTEGGSLFSRTSTPTPTPEPAAEAPADVSAEQIAEDLAEDTTEREQVAEVVPISALAGVRAEAAEQAEAEARARSSIANAFTTAPKKANEDLESSKADAPKPNPFEPPSYFSEPLVQSTALDDPVDTAPAVEAEPEAPVYEPEPVVETPTYEPEPVLETPTYEPEPVVETPTYEPAPVAEPIAETPPGPAPAAAPAEEIDAGVDEAAAAAVASGLGGGLPRRTRGAAPQINRDMPGLPTAAESAAARGGRREESPIFSSMRSGWLSSEGSKDFGNEEVDRGWARAARVADQAETPRSTTGGLPVRNPGQRLVPGSVEKPTTVAPRDPEAIRSRLSSAAAGISRGRQAAKSSTPHTEAGPS